MLAGVDVGGAGGNAAAMPAPASAEAPGNELLAFMMASFCSRHFFSISSNSASRIDRVVEIYARAPQKLAAECIVIGTLLHRLANSRAR